MDNFELETRVKSKLKIYRKRIEEAEERIADIEQKIAEVDVGLVELESWFALKE